MCVRETYKRRKRVKRERERKREKWGKKVDEKGTKKKRKLFKKILFRFNQIFTLEKKLHMFYFDGYNILELNK